MTSLNDKNILTLIALQLDDLGTWYAFALVCKNAAYVVKDITEKRSKNVDYHHKRHKEFFDLPLNPPPPKPEPFGSIVIGSSILTAGNIMFGQHGSGMDLNQNNVFWGECSKPPDNYHNAFLWCDGDQTFNINGNKTFSVKARGRGGEGIRFNNGAKSELTSKRYNDSMTWSYKPKNPEHWGGFAPPTSLAEACDRLAERLFELGGSIP
jgi:hypothetical protein